MHWVKYVMNAVLSQFQIFGNLPVFSQPNLYSQNFIIKKKCFFLKSVSALIYKINFERYYHKKYIFF